MFGCTIRACRGINSRLRSELVAVSRLPRLQRAKVELGPRPYEALGMVSRIVEKGSDDGIVSNRVGSRSLGVAHPCQSHLIRAQVKKRVQVVSVWVAGGREGTSKNPCQQSPPSPVTP